MITQLPLPLLSSPGAVDEEGRMPFYAEECASMLAVTFSGGDKMLRSIVSASWARAPHPRPTTLPSGSTARSPRVPASLPRPLRSSS